MGETKVEEGGGNSYSGPFTSLSTSTSIDTLENYIPSERNNDYHNHSHHPNENERNNNNNNNNNNNTTHTNPIPSTGNNNVAAGESVGNGVDNGDVEADGKQVATATATAS